MTALLLSLALHPAEAKKPKPADVPAMMTGTVGGEPFEVVRALASGDANHPGTLVVTLTDRPLACDDKPEPDATLLSIAFEPVAGTPSVGAGLVLNQKRKLIAFGAVDATLVTLPDAAGGTGTLRVTSFGKGQGGMSLSGDATFELCEVVAPAPPPQSAFEEQVVATGSDAGDPKVKARVPVDWKDAYDQLGNHVWTAQDGVTTFTLSATCGGACDPTTWADHAAHWQQEQTSAFAAAPGWKVELGKDEQVDEHTRVVRWTVAGNGGVPTSSAVVVRYAPEWDRMLVCELRTPAKNTEILDSAEQACLGTTMAQ